MKIHQYNQRIQFWFDTKCRTWFCQQNDIDGNVVDRIDEHGEHIPAKDAYTKKQILVECDCLEQELNNHFSNGADTMAKAEG